MKKFIPKIEYFTGLIKRFWLIILIVSVIGGALGGVISRIAYEPEYEMTQAFTIEVKSNPNANVASISETQLSKTIPALLSSDTFMEHMMPIIKDTGASGRFKITSLETSNIFYITCVARSNNDAQIIINEIQEHYTEIADYVIGESQMKFLSPPGYSKIPINTPHYTISALIGLVLGAIIVIALFVFLSLISTTITNPSEIEDEINIKCLSNVSKAYIKKRSGQRKEKVVYIENDNIDLEYKKSISTLSSNINQACMKNGFKSILITSTASNEGKSTIALNLAVDLTDKGNKVVIVDFDLRKPSIAKYIGIDDIEISLFDAIKTNNLAKCTTETRTDGLYFCGNIKDSGSDLENISDNELKALFEYLKSNFDYIIVDSAPIGFLGDAISICSFCDCFAFVVAYNYVHKPNIIRSISTISESNKNMLGFVLNNI